MKEMSYYYRLFKSKLPFAKNYKKFLQYSMDHMLDNNVSIKLINKKLVGGTEEEPSLNNGWFGNVYYGSKEFEFVVAVKKEFDQWFSVYVHEYCHFTQMKERCYPHKALGEVQTKKGNALDTFFSYIENPRIKVSKSDIEKSMKLVRNMELDNDKRSVDIIKKWNLPIDIRDYIRRTNSYMYFYTFALKNKTWVSRKRTYEVEEINSMMPVQFLDKNEYDIIPNGYEDLVFKHCV